MNGPEAVEIAVQNVDPASVPADPPGLAPSTPAPAAGGLVDQAGQIPAPAGGIFSRDNIRSAFDLAFNLGVSPQLGLHWKLTPQELDRLADAWAPQLQAWFPSIAAATEGDSGIVGLLLVNATVFGPRVALHFMRKAAAKHELPPAPGAPPAPAASSKPATDFPPGV